MLSAPSITNYVIAGLTMVCLVGGLLWQSQRLDATQKQLESTVLLVTAADARALSFQTQLTSIQAQVAAASKAAEDFRYDLSKALKANPADTAAPIPKPVRDSLCKKLRCSNK